MPEPTTPPASFGSSASKGPSASAVTFSVAVRDGRGRYRKQPVLASRLLVGTAKVCDLRLDDPATRPFHCLLTAEAGRLEIETVTPAAVLTVNGKAVERAELTAGDVVGIGDVRLAVHMHPMRLDVVRPPETNGPHFPLTEFEPVRTVAHRSAAELVELIEQEAERADEFEEQRRAGAAALLAAIGRSGCKGDLPKTDGRGRKTAGDRTKTATADETADRGRDDAGSEATPGVAGSIGPTRTPRRRAA